MRKSQSLETERQLALLSILGNNRYGLTNRQIFEKLSDFYSPASRQRSSAKKMFERDKEKLSDWGFPVITKPRGNDDTYYLEPRPAGLSPGFVLTVAESKTLGQVLADPAISGQLSGFALRALEKLLQLHSPELPGELPNRVERGESRLLRRILDAADKQIPLELEYHDREGQSQRRVFSPYGVFFRNGKAYLVAGCHKEKFTKVLSLRKIGRCAFSKKRFLSQPGEDTLSSFALSTDFLPKDSTHWHVKLRVGLGKAWKILERYPWSVTEKAKDGSVSARFGVSNPGQFFKFILQFGKHAEIINPPEARAAFLKYLGGKP